MMLSTISLKRLLGVLPRSSDGPSDNLRVFASTGGRMIMRQFETALHRILPAEPAGGR